MSAYETLVVERPEDGIAVATLNRPERMNALTFAAFAELHAVAEEIGADESVRALVLTGAGRGFCAGLDLDDAARLSDMTVPGMFAGQQQWAAAIAALRRMPTPVIAAVNGAAVGAGFGLALAADIRIAAPEARFSGAFVRIGLSGGDVGVSWLLPRIVGFGHAAELLLTGRLIGADDAFRLGIVNRVVPAEDLLDTAVALGREIAANSPFGIRLTKEILQTNVDAPSLEAAIALENRSQVLAVQTRDMSEALAAFREKRVPEFQNR
jgi:enoyl-CoA hydratase/carnithine racemase